MDQIAADVGSFDHATCALRPVSDFGANPGNLGMLAAVPPGLKAGRRPLVVVLHGCGQTAAGFDEASGWSRLGAEHGFVVIYPEQRRANNDQTCFSWFRPQDVARIGGEVESIRQMVGRATAEYGIDVRRIFVCGLSAGGAMACALLAAYPEVFAGGAVIAGLPFGAAASASEAFEAMYGGRTRDARVWGGLVRAATTGYAGGWPSISIWQGSADPVVRPVNADELVKQWTNVHGLDGVAAEEDQVGPATRRTWRDPAGRVCVTRYSLPGLGHGAAVAEREPPAPFFLPAGLSATRQIAEDFGITEKAPSGVGRLLAMVGLG